MSFFYGPVYSRRLGLSLGVDLTPDKRCSFDCIYCQVGETALKSSQRYDCVDYDDFKSELEEIKSQYPELEYVTFAGSGEPTLHKNLNKFIGIVRDVFDNDIKICVITNSSLLSDHDVRAELLGADLIMPSLDAGTKEIFTKINQPEVGVDFVNVVNGLKQLREEFKGSIWLEIMLLKGVNDSDSEFEAMCRLVKSIKPDKVQLNQPVRPTIYKVSCPLNDRIRILRSMLSDYVEVINDSAEPKKLGSVGDNCRVIEEHVKRRPATVEELAALCGVSILDLETFVTQMIDKGMLVEYIHDGKKFIKKSDDNENK